MKKVLLPGLLALVACVPAHASIILVDFTPVGGTGLGSVNTVLTLASPGATGLETGCVAPGAGNTTVTTGCGYANSNVQAQIGTPTLSALNITSAADLRIVFNASEPAGNAVTLNALTLTLYGTGGATDVHNLAAPLTFNNTATGTGNSGYLFRLSDAEAVTAQNFINTSGGLGTIRVGLGASVGCLDGSTTCAGAATGGLETFFVGNVASTGGPGGDPGAIPEPTTYLMLGGGLTLLALYRRKKAA
jgi:hypothetical protein